MKSKKSSFSWKPDSSVLKKVTYDAVNKTMDITFHENNRTYRYYDVTARVYNSIRLAESAGRYFNERIMNEYEYEEVF